MLAYLDALLAAVGARDVAEIERLIAHPLGRILTRAARAEAEAARARRTQGAPLRLLQLRHQTAQLLGKRAVGRHERGGRQPVPRSFSRIDRPAPRRQEIGRPLSA